MDPIVIKIALGGGLLFVFSVIHWVVDWVFQSHQEAMQKHNNAKVRAKHCLIYTLGFIPSLIILKFTNNEMLLALNILFWSHFCEDTYLPVYLWAKYIRRPAEMTDPVKIVGLDGYVTVTPPDPKRGFVEFISTGLGKILMISIDQLIHVLFLIPLVWMAFN